MFYYIIKHSDYEEPFMVFADDPSCAIDKVMTFLNDDGYYAEEGIASVERVDFDGVILK